MQYDHRIPRTRAGRSQGFTLLEMLVVMVLLSILMLALVSAMRGAGQSGQRVDAKLEQQDDVRVAEGFVRSTLGRISERKVTAAPGMSAAPVMFQGAPNQISWVGVLPARYGAGGRHFFRLGIEPVGNTTALVLRFGPWADQNEFPDFAALRSQVLLMDVANLNVLYENSTPENLDLNSEWVPAWEHPDSLPARAVLSIQRNAQLPLEWVVPLWSLPASRPNGVGDGEDVIGGTAV